MGATVLVVDDDATLRTLLTAVFAGAGLRVLVAASGPEALVIADETPVDLVVTDAQMPGMNGAELLAALRSRPRYADVPVFLCTGSHVGDIVTAAEAAGVTAVLPKPMRPKELLAAVLPHVATVA
jgi:two-component system, chemotaxis family, chemotaxis protein CheY